MRGLNRVQLLGNLGHDPEARTTTGGAPIVTFSVAVNRNTRTADGEWEEGTDWFRVVAWDVLAEIAGQYLHRGSKVYVEGRLQIRTWDDGDGQKHTATEIVAGEIILLDSRPAAPSMEHGNAPAGAGGDDEDEPF